MKKLLPPETEQGILNIGDELPGVGTVAELRPLVGLLDRVRGKYHDGDAVYLLKTRDGTKYKLLTAKTPAGVQTPYTRHTAAHLAAFPDNGSVPSLVYVDDCSLIVEFVAGKVLSQLELTHERTKALARFIAASQPASAPEDYGGADSNWLRQQLEQNVQLTESVRLFAIDVLQRWEDIAVSEPQAVCYFDGALKNFIEHPSSGKLSYIDLFGLSATSVSISFVRQVLALPASRRAMFINTYLEASPYGEYIRDHLPFYCLLHLSYRLAHQFDTSEQAAGRNRYRRQKRRASAQAAQNALADCMSLASEFEVYRDRLLQLEL